MRGGSETVLIVDQMAVRPGVDPVTFPLILSVPSPPAKAEVWCYFYPTSVMMTGLDASELQGHDVYFNRRDKSELCEKIDSARAIHRAGYVIQAG